MEWFESRSASEGSDEGYRDPRELIKEGGSPFIKSKVQDSDNYFRSQLMKYQSINATNSVVLSARREEYELGLQLSKAIHKFKRERQEFLEFRAKNDNHHNDFGHVIMRNEVCQTSDRVVEIIKSLNKQQEMIANQQVIQMQQQELIMEIRNSMVGGNI